MDILPEQYQLLYQKKIGEASQRDEAILEGTVRKQYTVMLEDGPHKISLDRLLSLPRRVRIDLVNMFWHNGMFNCKTAKDMNILQLINSAFGNMESATEIEIPAMYVKIFQYLINGDFGNIKSSTEIETSTYLEIYIYAAAYRWMEVVKAARSKIACSDVIGVLKKLAVLKKLDVVATSADDIEDEEMLAIWAKASELPEEFFSLKASKVSAV